MKSSTVADNYHRQPAHLNAKPFQDISNLQDSIVYDVVWEWPCINELVSSFRNELAVYFALRAFELTFGPSLLILTRCV